MPETTEEDIDTCRRANEAALEKGLSFCDTTEARLSVLGRLFGYDDIDAEEIESVDPDDEGVTERKRVLSRAEELIDGDGEDQPLDVLQQAWNDVATVEQGPDHDEDEDGDESGDEDEAEAEADEDDEETETVTVDPLDDEDEESDD